MSRSDFGRVSVFAYSFNERTTDLFQPRNCHSANNGSRHFILRDALRPEGSSPKFSAIFVYALIISSGFSTSRRMTPTTSNRYDCDNLVLMLSSSIKGHSASIRHFAASLYCAFLSSWACSPKLENRIAKTAINVGLILSFQLTCENSIRFAATLALAPTAATYLLVDRFTRQARRQELLP